MRTDFRPEQLTDPHLRDAEKALRTCVHCGFCTATCPTYLVLGDERDSPRGRIMLMQTMLENGGPSTSETVTHLDRCLSCLGCKSACPSGVDYSALIDTARLHIAKTYKRPPGDRLFRAFILFVLMRPALFSLAAGAARVFAPFLPGKLGAMAKKAARAPKRGTGSTAALETPPSATRVTLLKGCVQSALAPHFDEAIARVLARGGVKCEASQGCCGALAYHMGRDDIAKAEARKIIAAFEASGAAHISIAATGCSAFLKDYGRVFAGDPEWETRARAVAAKAKDFSELAPMPTRATIPQDLVVAYHPPCSQQHGQRLAGRGEKLLADAGFKLVPIPDAHLCCGSAGSYSLTQPEISEKLRANKLAAIRATGATLIASANIGCLAHLSGELPVVHIAELLDWAADGPKPRLD